MNSRELILAHLAGKPVDRLPFMPITMQFAADQAGVKYGPYATDHRVLVEAQICTAEKFGIDYVSAISDPGREAADVGADVAIFEDQPPAIREDNAFLADKTKLIGLKPPDPLGGGRMTDRVQGVALFKERVGKDKLIEGWIEGPIAEAADLRGINTVMMDLFDDPVFIADLFEFILDMELRFAKAQIAAGADLIGIGDAAASLIGPGPYQEHVWSYEKRLVDGVRQMGAMVRLHICGNTSRILGGMGKLGCEIVDLDYMVTMAAGRKAMGPDQVLLGNLEPVGVIRNQTPEQIHQAIAAGHQAAGPRFIVGAGCEIVRDTADANLHAMGEYARTHKP